MTDDNLTAFREHLAVFAKRSPAEKAELLRELGVIGPDGKLTAEYGGQPFDSVEEFRDLRREWRAAKGPPVGYIEWLEREVLTARGGLNLATRTVQDLTVRIEGGIADIRERFERDHADEIEMLNERIEGLENALRGKARVLESSDETFGITLTDDAQQASCRGE